MSNNKKGNEDKNLLQNSWDNIYSMAYEKRESRHFPRRFLLIGYFFAILWMIDMALPFVMNESFIKSSNELQEFIFITTAIIPGIDAISNESSFSEVMALQIALSWIIIIFLTVVLFFNSDIRSGFESMFDLKSFAIVLIWILNEFILGFVISYFHGSGFDLHGTKTGLFHFLLQHRIGAGILITFMIFYEVVLLVWFSNYCRELFKNLIMGDR